MLEEKNLGGESSNGKNSGEQNRIAELEKKLEQLIAAQASNNQANGSGVTPEFLEKLIDKVSSNGSNSPKDTIDSEFQYVDEAIIDPDDFIEEGHVFWVIEKRIDKTPLIQNNI